jgi:hypothetical protein
VAGGWLVGREVSIGIVIVLRWHGRVRTMVVGMIAMPDWMVGVPVPLSVMQFI